MRQQHVSPSTPGKCWKQKTTKKGKQRKLDGLLLLLLQPTADQITKEKSKCSKIRERNCWPCIDQNNPRSSRSDALAVFVQNTCANYCITTAQISLIPSLTRKRDWVSPVLYVSHPLSFPFLITFAADWPPLGHRGWYTCSTGWRQGKGLSVWKLRLQSWWCCLAT